MSFKTFVLLAISTFTFAGDPPLTPDASKALADYQKAEENAKVEFEKRVGVARDKAVTALQAAMTKATRAGDLTGALAIKAEVDKLAGPSAPTPPNKVEISHAEAIALNKAIKAGQITDEQWNAIGSDPLTVNASGLFDTGIVAKKGEVYVVVPSPTDTWTGSANKLAEYPLVTYLGSKTVAGQMAMQVKIESNIMDSFMTVGEGRILVGPNDSKPGDNGGQIRIKIIKVK